MSEPTTGDTPTAVGPFDPRERVLGMVFRAELDPDGFGAELKADPIAALRKAGFSAPQAQSLLNAGQQAAANPESLIRAGCSDTTCGISLCPSTCYITIPAGNPSTCPLFSIWPT